MSKKRSEGEEYLADQGTPPEVVVLLVSDPQDPKHGEITLLDGSDEAERMIEALLEAGFEQERIRVFTGSEAGISVTFRPVVTFAEGGAHEAQEPELAGAESGDGHTGSPERFSHLFRGASEQVG